MPDILLLDHHIVEAVLSLFVMVQQVLALRGGRSHRQAVAAWIAVDKGCNGKY